MSPTLPKLFSRVSPDHAPRPSDRSPSTQLSSHGSGVTKARTSHACDRCRLLRTRCSGGDRCAKCTKDNAACHYGDRKRERNKKYGFSKCEPVECVYVNDWSCRDLAESEARNRVLEEERTQLLAALRSVVSGPGFRADYHGDVLELISKYSSRDQSQHGQSSSMRSQSTSSPFRERQSWTSSGAQSQPEAIGRPPGEKAVASSVGSPGRQGELFEAVDLDGGSGASGYVGKMSEMSWIRRGFECVRARGGQVGPDAGVAEISHHLTTAPDYCYFMDNTDVLAVNEDQVEAYAWPPGDGALILAEAYFHAMQGAFQFILREQFLPTLFHFPRHGMPSWSQRRWLAMANLVWAVGSLWLEVTKLDRSEQTDTHLLYYARARVLGIDHRILFDHPDIDRVQAIGLLAFYLLINGSVTRAWNTLGQAIRHAIALGLHLKVSDHGISEANRERRAQTWHSLYSLEILLCEIVGRPRAVSLEEVTIPCVLTKVPRAADEESRNTHELHLLEESRKMWVAFLGADRNIPQVMGVGVLPWKSLVSVGQDIPAAYLPQRLQLCRLSDKIATKLFRGTSECTWSETQQKISELQEDFKNWADNLPAELTMQSSLSLDTDPRVKIELALYYHSLQMILYRPCLCEIEIEDESVESQKFNRNAARACVHAAMSMLAIMPDNPKAHEVHQLLPWWALLHYVAQATAVILLEMSFGMPHSNNETKELASHLRKAMAYLYCMTEGSLSAYRAWRIFQQLLWEVTNKYGGLGLQDIPRHAVQPHGWRQDHEAALRRAFG